jgi:hypothetical protein
MANAKLAAAVHAMLTGDGNVADANLVSAKAPKAKAEVQTPVMKLETNFGIYFSEEQVLAVVEFHKGMIDAIGSYDSARRSCILGLHAAFPKGVTHNQWTVISGAAKLHDDGGYMYQQSCIAIRMMKAHGAKWAKDGTLEELGELPAKNGGTKAGKRAPSPAKWQKTNTAKCKQLRDHIAQVSKFGKDVEPATLKQVTKVLKALDAALILAARIKVA